MFVLLWTPCQAVNSPGSLLKIEASATYVSDGKEVTTTGHFYCIVTSPIYREAPVYCATYSPLLFGMKRKVLLTSPTGLIMSVASIGIQANDGSLLVNNELIPPGAFQGGEPVVLEQEIIPEAQPP